MRLAPHTDGMNILLGRAAPSQTLPREEVWGNPVSPYPLLEGQALPRAGAWGNQVSPHPCSSSLCSRQAPCAGRTPPDANGPGARAAHPRRVSAGKMPALPAYVHISRPCGSAAHEQDEHRFFLGGRSPPKPSHRAGYGETGFPHTPPTGAYVHVSTSNSIFPCSGKFGSLSRRMTSYGPTVSTLAASSPRAGCPWRLKRRASTVATPSTARAAA